jgi:hypothetical protein
MDRVRAARGGQEPTASTTRLIRGYSRIDAYYGARFGLRSTRGRAEVLEGSLHKGTSAGVRTKAELRMLLDGQQPQRPSEGGP